MSTQSTRWRATGLLTLAIGSVLVAAACSSPDVAATTISLDVSTTTMEQTETTTTTVPPTTTSTTAATTTTTEATATTEPAAVDVEPSAIAGTWRGPNYYITFVPDEDRGGTWGVYVEPRSRSAFDSGTYTFDGVTLTMFSREQGSCLGGVGTYEVTFSASLDEIRPSAVKADECPERQSEMTPRMSRYGS
jgi:hypothetical protein